MQLKMHFRNGFMRRDVFGVQLNSLFEKPDGAPKIVLFHAEHPEIKPGAGVARIGSGVFGKQELRLRNLSASRLPASPTAYDSEVFRRPAGPGLAQLPCVLAADEHFDPFLLAPPWNSDSSDTRPRSFDRQSDCFRPSQITWRSQDSAVQKPISERSGL